MRLHAHLAPDAVRRADPGQQNALGSPIRRGQHGVPSRLDWSSRLATPSHILVTLGNPVNGPQRRQQKVTG